MTIRLRRALHLSGLAALALATAGCGGDDSPVSKNGSSFSLFDPIGADQWPGGFADAVPEFSEADYFGDALAPLPEAAPMVREVREVHHDYGYAPDYYDDYPVSEPVYYDDTPSDNSYAWLALAAMLGGVLGDAPPDYYFDYDGVEPWVWETGDHFVRYAEPLDYGYRYYYYSPGRSYPFLVRDPYYSYGYYDDRPVVIYDSGGRVLDWRRSWRQRRAAERYYARARDLHEAARLRPRYGVAAPLWDERRTIIAREQRQWDSARDRRTGWRNWDRRRDRDIAPRWTGERVARQYAADRFDRWRADDYRGQAPRFYAEAERSPRLRQAVAQQREQRRAAIAERRGDRRALIRSENPRQSASWRRMQAQDQGDQRIERRAFRDQARDDRLRSRQERFAAQRGRDEVMARRQNQRNEFRQAQTSRDQARLERRAAAQRGSEQRLRAGGENRAVMQRARREARSEQQAQAFRAQRQEARAQQRSQVRSQARQEARMQRVRAQSQARQEARMQQRMQARPQARQESRMQQRMEARSQARQESRMQQRMQDRSQLRQEARMQQRAAMQSQTRQEFRAQRQPRQEMRQARQEFRQQRQQQAEVRQARANDGGGRPSRQESRVAERQERGHGNGRRMN